MVIIPVVERGWYRFDLMVDRCRLLGASGYEESYWGNALALNEKHFEQIYEAETQHDK